MLPAEASERHRRVVERADVVLDPDDVGRSGFVPGAADFNSDRAALVMGALFADLFAAAAGLFVQATSITQALFLARYFLF